MISGTFYPEVNGTVIAIANLIKALKNRGHTIQLITRAMHGAPSNELWEGVKVMRVGPSSSGILWRSLLMINYFWHSVSLVKEGYDVIHAHGFYALIVAQLLGRIFRIPVVVNFHGFQRLWFKEARWRSETTFTFIYPIERFLLKKSGKVILQSRTLMDILKKAYNIIDKDAEIIPHPLDTTIFRFSERNTEDKYNVVFVGSLIRVHGVDLLLESAPIVLKQIPEAKFIIIGGGPMKKLLEKQISRLGLSDKVYLIGRITDRYILAQAYANSSVVVIPLRYKGYILSYVALEAMAIGRPVITTMSLDPELASYGVYMVKTNFEEIAKAIIMILQIDNREYKLISESTRKYIELYCSQDAVAKKVETIYFRLLMKGA